jgi:hypothetical protein
MKMSSPCSLSCLLLTCDLSYLLGGDFCGNLYFWVYKNQLLKSVSEEERIFGYQMKVKLDGEVVGKIVEMA